MSRLSVRMLCALHRRDTLGRGAFSGRAYFEFVELRLGGLGPELVKGLNTKSSMGRALLAGRRLGFRDLDLTEHVPSKHEKNADQRLAATMRCVTTKKRGHVCQCR